MQFQLTLLGWDGENPMRETEDCIKWVEYHTKEELEQALRYYNVANLVTSQDVLEGTPRGSDTLDTLNEHTAAEEELTTACNWVTRKFDSTRTFDQIDNILETWMKYGEEETA